MRKKNIVILNSVVMLCIIFACAGVGKVTADSYIDNVELEDYLSNPDLKVGYCGIGYDAERDRGFVDPGEVESVKDLIAEDTVIVKAKLNCNFQRKLYYECILSELDVLAVYKGNLNKEDMISVFEPVDCYSKIKMDCTDGYSMMQDGTEYILFLKPLKNTYYGDDKYVYAPSSTTYSKYALNDSIPELFPEKELEEIEFMNFYKDVKEEEMYLYDSEDYNKYVRLKKQVLDKFDAR